MRKNSSPKEPGMFKAGAYFVVIAIIAVKTLRAVLNIAVKTYDGIATSRNQNRK